MNAATSGGSGSEAVERTRASRWRLLRVQYHFHIRQLPLPVGSTSERLAGSRIFVMHGKLCSTPTESMRRYAREYDHIWLYQIISEIAHPDERSG